MPMAYLFYERENILLWHNAVKDFYCTFTKSASCILQQSTVGGSACSHIESDSLSDDDNKLDLPKKRMLYL